ncbi:MAG: histidine--tRNA ligase [Nitrospinae bacterium]|nr:histidine--tRNA ligase [Nitrospinota bacterium]
MKYRAIKGVKDILPGETEKWYFIERHVRDIFETFGFSEIKIPIIEKTPLFVRGIGETTDIVEKEMYSFEDKGGDSITLRPEGTASVVRAYIEHGLYNSHPLTKLWYIGPMFRHERPQAGRYRQFYQIGAEVFGEESPSIDADIIVMLMELFKRLGLNETELQLNSLGCERCRPLFRERLLDFIKNRLPMLCEDCNRRFESNPLRVLDCKSKNCSEVIRDSPSMDGSRCEGCQRHLDGVIEYLLITGIKYRLNPRLARGLDYYTRTTFEVTDKRLGAQDAIAGGGRYDSLVEDLGGPQIPAIGFAIGMERLASLIDMGDNLIPPSSPKVYIAAMGEEANRKAFDLLYQIRLRGISGEMNYSDQRFVPNKSLKSQLRKGDQYGVSYTLIIGDNEIKSGKVILRDMKRAEQEEIDIQDIVEVLVKRIGR